jgi:DNA-directed RNA polymerase subunit RPC12/RpoP
MPSGIRLTHAEVAAYFEQHGCKLLESEYKNARTKMQYVCSCGNESVIVFDSFRTGNRCRSCGNKRCADKLRLTHVEVAAYFKEQGCELLDEYQGNLVPMRYVCSCGEQSTINWNNFKTKGNRCQKCGIAKRSGSNHYDWREDREQADLNDTFRQRCYKLVRMVLNVTGRVKNERSAKLLGYDYKQLQEHVTSHPNWEKVKGEKWHVDHVFPIKAFIDHGVSDLKIINALDNLRPLGAKANMCKNGKYDKDEFLKYLKRKGVRHETPSDGVRAHAPAQPFQPQLLGGLGGESCQANWVNSGKP